MTASGVRDNARLGPSIGRGILILFLIQLALQLISISSNSDFKGGLISIRTLVWEGLGTQPVLFALLYHFLVYLVILTVISAVGILSAEFIRSRLRSGESPIKLQVLFLLLLYAALMVINVWHYPNSLARLALISSWQAGGSEAAYYIAISICLAFLASAAAELAPILVGWWRRIPTGKRWAGLIAIAVLVSSFIYAQPGREFMPGNPGDSDPAAGRPNIILIGLDSVRVDIIEDEALRRSFLPHLDRFLRQDNTTWFPNAYTPIARTFAAWYALLTGKEPRMSGIRYNLQRIPSGHKRDTIARDLGSNGYLTVYGSDEKRFSTIDESYGFDETFGPPVGAAEWILSIMEDTPAHNIFRETPLAPLLFPHTFGNRASYTTFKPEHFVELVRRRVDSFARRQPVFLSIHLCLSHWPYTWSTGNTHARQSLVEDYFDTLTPLDQQFGDILELLRDSGLLDHSVVIVFTDHGEGLVSDAMADDDPRWKDFQAHLPTASDVTLGHGSDLLTITQNQVMISLQDNTGHRAMAAGKNGRFTSLLDIAPTIARFGGLTGFESRGIDLADQNAVRGGSRVIFMETGIDLAALKQATLNLEDLVREGVSAYEIDSDGLLQVKEAYHERIIDRKQKGVTDGRYILSNRPGSFNAADGQAEILALEIEDPTRSISSAEIESDSELNHLRDQLQAYYGEELQAR